MPLRRGVLDRRDVLDLTHGRSRMTIEPRIPSMRDGACQVSTDEADIASTKREPL